MKRDYEIDESEGVFKFTVKILIHFVAHEKWYHIATAELLFGQFSILLGKREVFYIFKKRSYAFLFK